MAVTETAIFAMVGGTAAVSICALITSLLSCAFTCQNSRRYSNDSTTAKYRYEKTEWHDNGKKRLHVKEAKDAEATDIDNETHIRMQHEHKENKTATTVGKQNAVYRGPGALGAIVSKAADALGFGDGDDGGNDGYTSNNVHESEILVDDAQGSYEGDGFYDAKEGYGDTGEPTIMLNADTGEPTEGVFGADGVFYPYGTAPNIRLAGNASSHIQDATVELSTIPYPSMPGQVSHYALQ